MAPRSSQGPGQSTLLALPETVSPGWRQAGQSPSPTAIGGSGHHVPPGRPQPPRRHKTGRARVEGGGARTEQQVAVNITRARGDAVGGDGAGRAGDQVLGHRGGAERPRGRGAECGRGPQRLHRADAGERGATRGEQGCDQRPAFRVARADAAAAAGLAGAAAALRVDRLELGRHRAVVAGHRLAAPVAAPVAAGRVRPTEGDLPTNGPKAECDERSRAEATQTEQQGNENARTSAVGV